MEQDYVWAFTLDNHVEPETIHHDVLSPDTHCFSFLEFT
jgi:hypothetical protein